MLNLKSQIEKIIYSSIKNPIDRRKWLSAEKNALGLKHHGLDELSTDSILPLVTLYTNGSLEFGEIDEILRVAEIDSSNLQDYIDIAIEYDFLSECQASGHYELTEKGISACKDIFKNVVTRIRYELKNELKDLDRIYTNLQVL